MKLGRLSLVVAGCDDEILNKFFSSLRYRPCPTVCEQFVTGVLNVGCFGSPFNVSPSHRRLILVNQRQRRLLEFFIRERGKVVIVGGAHFRPSRRMIRDTHSPRRRHPHAHKLRAPSHYRDQAPERVSSRNLPIPERTSPVLRYRNPLDGNLQPSE